ncbi:MULTISPECIES: type II toxin-antitoxin system VapC family toxin [unclassified Meiothermus]|uniref:type II toxin-antitoxin system VapC family toxin n=1 Tax=unclassified Meiothermus TaxID=370471 RepID=UPI000D7CDD52|nr:MULTISPECIES: PIN domain-containing protein [unclassified Meiothermus]PZA08192.1 VapC toxin family PIN domain ribonuclease [Meiothermus sp. Pnk-1]RYM36771.1 PIN domain-containing protein [Meiothermus sp. PNK-Is4]
MPLLVDTGILFAYYDKKDFWHPQARALLDAEDSPPVLPAPAIAEADYLLSTRLGFQGQLALYDDITQGVYLVANLSPEGYKRVLQLNQQYADLRLGFVDAAIIAIAEELGIGAIATTDRRHLGAVQAKIGLELLP